MEFLWYESNKTPLHHAASALNGPEDIVLVLLTHPKIDINIQDILNQKIIHEVFKKNFFSSSLNIKSFIKFCVNYLIIHH